MHKKQRIIAISIIFVIIFVLIILLVPKINEETTYEIKYTEYVEKYAEQNNIDKYLIYAVIRTESSFDEKAESNVGARGLMQIMPDAFDWVKMKLNDKREITFDDMFTAEYNIEYCSYYLGYLMKKYNNNVSLTAAAYHAGFNQVDRWLEDTNISQNGKTIEKYPSSVTNHYVKKVTNAYKSYKNLYDK